MPRIPGYRLEGELFRGGQGVVKAQRFLSAGFVTHESDRHEDAPWGIFGGKPGAVGKFEIYNIKKPEVVGYFPAKFSGLRANEGDVAAYYSPSGGGYGNPLERPAQQVYEDVLDGFITVEHAKEAYGVALVAADNGYGWALDESGTTAMRARMAV